MSIEKLYYNGKCIMTFDDDYMNDYIYEHLREVLAALKDRVYDEFGFGDICKSEARKIWAGKEEIYVLRNQVEAELEQKYENNPFEKTDQLYKIMEEKLSSEEFEIFKKLRNEEVQYCNEFDMDFLSTNENWLDYMWIEREGKIYSYW